MLRKAEEHLANQRQHEAETQARLEAARKRRKEDKERQEAIEVRNLLRFERFAFIDIPQREKEEMARIEAEKLEEERRLAREQALEWTREVRMDSDDEQEREKRPKRPKKAKADVASGDEAEPKKKKRGKIKKSGVEQGEEDQAMFSEEDDAGKPTKKVSDPRRFLLFFVYSLSAAF